MRHGQGCRHEKARTTVRWVRVLASRAPVVDARAGGVDARAEAPPAPPAAATGTDTHVSRARRDDPGTETVGSLTSGIRNKQRRSELYGKLKHERAVAKKKRRETRQKAEAEAIEAGETPEPRQIPKTIENTRVKDETYIEDTNDADLIEQDAEDEFASYFSQATSPKIIVTTSRNPSGDMFKFLENLFTVIPNAYYYARRTYHVKEIVKHGTARGFTDILVFNENKKFSKGARVNGMLHIHLPEGPTCLYKLSSLVLSKEIKNHGRATSHYPELILNNFNTRLGHRVGRMFASVFPQKPEFKGRRVVTFHNQRDFIFFRHHRYVFEEKKGRRLPHAGHLASAEVPEHVKQSIKEGGRGKKGSKKKSSKKATDSDDDDEDDDSDSDSDSGSASEKEDDKPPPISTMIQARLQELGPRFTLRLMSVQKGTFDSKHGEYEYVRNTDTDGTRHCRRKFVL